MDEFKPQSQPGREPLQAFVLGKGVNMTSNASVTQQTQQTQEPVVVYTSIGVVIAAIAGLFGIVVDPGTVANAVLAVIAVASPLIAALKARGKVTPVA